ncbi:hypothetical protein [Lactococcus lactis]|jgi:hypothetical protein|uniref:hypothetical protein n=1 Tax=Lactococcus lactis TaxID=1358 RepID=UPI001121FCEC|nr:hypothetical protein [Lactococcus lactis]TNU81166.1 hypothetical protein FIB48_02280 [Lactococcus lactis subsp. lactis]
MSNGMIELKKREKKSIVLENNLTEQYSNLEDLHDVLLELVEDKAFIDLCKSGEREGAILYLAEKGIVGLRDVEDSKNLKNVVAYPEVAIAGLEVLVLVCAVAVIAPTIVFTIRETEPDVNENMKTTLYTPELNYCMEIISKFGNNKFSEEMYQFFLAIENGDTYIVNRKSELAYAR